MYYLVNCLEEKLKILRKKFITFQISLFFACFISFFFIPDLTFFDYFLFFIFDYTIIIKLTTKSFNTSTLYNFTLHLYV